jgi:SulP family sulfate permease
MLRIIFLIIAEGLDLLLLNKLLALDFTKRIRARKNVDENGVKHYEIYGPLFFASTTAFAEKFDILNDPKEVIIDFSESRVVDMSAIESLNNLTERYQKQNKKVHLEHLSPDCRRLLKNAETLIDVNVIEDPTYNVMLNG